VFQPCGRHLDFNSFALGRTSNQEGKKVAVRIQVERLGYKEKTGNRTRKTTRAKIKRKKTNV